MLSAGGKGMLDGMANMGGLPGNNLLQPQTQDQDPKQSYLEKLLSNLGAGLFGTGGLSGFIGGVPGPGMYDD